MSRLIDSLNAVQRGPAEPDRIVKDHTALWIALWSSVFFVFLTNEVLPLAGYPLNQTYRLQLVAERYELLPLAVFGSMALLIGPVLLFSRPWRKAVAKGRLLTGIYAISVACAAAMALAFSWNEPLMPAIWIQVAVWLVCTFMAYRATMRHHSARMREWLPRSYAVTFTFVSLRMLGLWPAYWNLSDESNMFVMIVAVLASLLAVDIGLSWHEADASSR